MPRPSRERMLMDMAVVASRRSTCQRAQVGAVIAREGRVLSIGYNGAPPGVAHCKHVVGDKEPCTNAIHAELNAIAWAARHGVSLDDSTMYCTHQPCQPCGQAILAAGLQAVLYLEPYPRNAYKFPAYFPNVHFPA